MGSAALSAGEASRHTERVLYPGGKVRISYQAIDKGGTPIPHGVLQEYFPSGVVMREYRYREGTLHGKTRGYYASGKIQWKGRYKNGKKMGKWVYFSRHGKKQMVAHFGQNGLLKTVTQFKKDGKKVRKAFYRDGNVVREDTFGPSGTHHTYDRTIIEDHTDPLFPQ